MKPMGERRRFFFMSSFNGGTTDPAWFDAMQLMLDTVGPDDPRYLWWSSVVGSALPPVLVNMELMCIQPAFTYPEMNQENIDALGLVEMCRLWMFEYFQFIYRTP